MPKIHVVYVKTQLQRLRKIGLNRMYGVLKRFFSFNSLEKIMSMEGHVNGRSKQTKINIYI